MRKLKKYVVAMLIMLSLVAVLVGCGQNSSSTTTTPDTSNETTSTEVETATEVVPIATTPVATIVVKDYGTIQLELYPEMAPNTVNNFITLANEGFYDGLIFHRVIDGFMIQGGDPEGIGIGGPGYSIAGEFANNGYTQNTLSHEKGVISMARAQNPDSAGSQFFITSEDSTFLDKDYAAFGKVISGLDVVDAIQKTETDRNDKPVDDVVIESITVETNGVSVPSVIKVGE